MERLVTASPDDRRVLETELRRRCGVTERRAALRHLFLARSQDADEYLGASAETARLYLALLDALPRA